MMNNSSIFILALSLFFSFSILDCYSNLNTKKSKNQEFFLDVPDEIIFYSNGSTFAPVIVLQADAEVIWTWADNTTSTSLTPTKDYGSAQLRQNRLKVTPWSALRRINIGYDAGDGGTNTIEFVNDQHISLVENLNLVAPYLKEWCSSYNDLISLDLSNFINIETIECYLSRSLQNVNLLNTPKLRRACFEDNNLLSLDLSDCSSLEDLRGAVNNYSTLTFPNQSDNAWHLCLRDNPQITNQHLINDLSPFPKIAELWIWNSNQQGDLIILKTNPTRTVSINAYNNHFSSIDFRGSLLNVNAGGIVDLRYNELTTVDISGCIQIKKLDLSHNMLNSEAIDQILKQVDEYGTIDLRYNQPPTNIRLVSKTNLESRGWIVNTDIVIPVESISLSGGTSINTDNGTLQLSATVLPDDATNKSIVWSVVNETGIAAISASGLLTAQKDGTVKVIATANDGSGVIGELTITITNQLIPVESISLSGGTSINTDNGTLQLSATALPDDATNKSIVWSVVNETGIAAISASGLITAQKDGTVKAVASANDGSGVIGELTITITNQVIPVESITIIDDLKEDTIHGIETKVTLKASIAPQEATNQKIDWLIENITGKASIDHTGLLITLSDGLIKVIAKATDESQCFHEKEYIIALSVTNQPQIITRNYNIFPNPAQGKIQIQIYKMPANGIIIEIRNSVGQILQKKIIFENLSEWTLNDYASTLFFITIIDKDIVFTQKITNFKIP